MKFKFYEQESKIADFLKFPRLLYFTEQEELDKKDNGQDIEGLIYEGYAEFCANAENRLQPFADKIELFYARQNISKYDFIDLLLKAYSLLGHKTETDFLDALLSLNEGDIKRSILYSTMMIEQEITGFSERIMNNAESISANKDEVIGFIKDLPVSAGSKWNLFLIVQEPLKYMGMYVSLMKKLLPVFQEFYEPYQTEVRRYGRSLADTLNKNGDKRLNELTLSIMDTNLLHESNSNLLVSAIFPYTIVIGAYYVAWGLKMEEAFGLMNKMNENRTSERVHIFKALSDKTRYEVLKLIAAGITSTKEIAGNLNVSSATISYHINTFITSKVIKLEKGENKYKLTVDYDMLERTLDGFKEDLSFRT